MNDEAKAAVEHLICALFVEMLELAQMYGITVKRMRELLPAVQLRALEDAGLDQGEIKANSGYTRKWIRKILSEPLAADDTNPVDQFISQWAADPLFPNALAIKGAFPSFEHLHDKYGGEFTAPGLLKSLCNRGVVELKGDRVRLDPDRKMKLLQDTEIIQGAQASLTALFGTLKHNLANHEQAYTERRILSANVPPENVPMLRAEMEKVNLENRKRIIQTLTKYEVPTDDIGTRPMTQVGVGLFWFEKQPKSP